MPEFIGKRVTNEVIAAKAATRWKSVSLLRTKVDDLGIIDLCGRALNATELQLQSDLITDAAMEAICSLPKLRSLLMDTVPHVGDVGITHVSRIKDLRELYLNGTGLTDEVVKSFASAEHLWSLALNRTRITDAGVSALADGPALRILQLQQTLVRGSTLADAHLADGASLYLAGCPIDDAAIEKLAQHHPTIGTLDLSGTNITDRCMPAIATLQGLEDLRLTGTAISDRGLAPLRDHPMLLYIYLQDTSVTEHAALEFRSSFNRDFYVLR